MNYTTTLNDEASEYASNIPGFPNYHITDDGRLFFNKEGVWVQRKSNKTTNNYERFTLRVNGESFSLSAHRLVLLSFFGPPPEKNSVCRHLDGNSRNNHISNLKWGTSKENSADTIQHGRQVRGRRIVTSKLSDEDVVSIFQEFFNGESIGNLSEKYKIHRTNLRGTLLRKNWTHVPIHEELIAHARNTILAKNTKNYSRRFSEDDIKGIFDFIKEKRTIHLRELEEKFKISYRSLDIYIFSPEKAELRRELDFDSSKYQVKSKCNILDEDVPVVFEMYRQHPSIIRIAKFFKADKATVRKTLLRQFKNYVFVDQNLIDECQAVLKKRLQKPFDKQIKID